MITGLANDASGMLMDLDCEYEFYGTSMGIGGWDHDRSQKMMEISLSKCTRESCV